MTAQHILVVDDESAMRDFLHDVLRKRGYEVTKSETAVDALRLAENGKFDLIILDIALADADGLDLLEILKRKEPHRPVIMMTGMGFDDELAQEALARHATNCVSKTTPIDQLLEEVRRAISQGEVNQT